MESISFDDLLEIFKEAERIFTSSISWEAKFDLIFSDRISKRVDLDWVDPDTSYEDDVTAFMRAFYEYMGEEAP